MFPHHHNTAIIYRSSSHNAPDELLECSCLYELLLLDSLMKTLGFVTARENSALPPGPSLIIKIVATVISLQQNVFYAPNEVHNSSCPPSSFIFLPSSSVLLPMCVQNVRKFWLIYSANATTVATRALLCTTRACQTDL